LEADTPLHKAVRFVNELSKTDWSSGGALVELLLDAGADPRFVPRALVSLSRSQQPEASKGHCLRPSKPPLGEEDNRIRNKAKLKAFELVDPRNTDLRTTLQKAEFAQMAGDDVVKEEDEDEDEGPTGSASDSE
ncbi:MAG: hypothetical protein Q9187_007885, partial [Circinaria calcarea]